ncbi:MAG: hypothetical protein M1816_004755 [Peltula sp. TS41687]|nr:MAG: hypothetical protein M1816_004755 [Peltula sp. TS41687]
MVRVFYASSSQVSKVALIISLIDRKTVANGDDIKDAKSKNAFIPDIMGAVTDGGKDHGTTRHRQTNSGSLPCTPTLLGSGHGEEASTKKAPKAGHETTGTGNAHVGSAPSGVSQQQTKTRKRKGSLRKTALLGGTGRSVHMDSSRGGRKGYVPTAAAGRRIDDEGVIPESSSLLERRHESTALSSQKPAIPTAPSSAEQHDRPHTGLLSLPIIPTTQHGHRRIPTTTATTTSPTLGETETSTTETDEEDAALSISYRGAPDLVPSSSSPSSSKRRPPPPAPSASSASYFPPVSPDRQHSRPKSPLSTSASPARTPSPSPSEDEWDYSATEWWGWVVLALTWIVFVVGMGSCLGVWSWAWDVGETPYAPPELEDDPTLPIVGYYPALMILTGGVMAWVWVVVAWIGMKYFKHAKITGEDT